MSPWSKSTRRAPITPVVNMRSTMTTTRCVGVGMLISFKGRSTKHAAISPRARHAMRHGWFRPDASEGGGRCLQLRSGARGVLAAEGSQGSEHVGELERTLLAGGAPHTPGAEKGKRLAVGTWTTTYCVMRLTT